MLTYVHAEFMPVLFSPCDHNPAVHLSSHTTQIPHEDLGDPCSSLQGSMPWRVNPNCAGHPPTLCMFTCHGLGRPVRLEPTTVPVETQGCAILRVTGR